MKPLPSFYTSRIEKFAAEENSYLQKSRRFASLRILTALVVLIALWQAVMTSHTGWILLLLGGVLLFPFLVRLHAKATEARAYFSRLKTINEREKAALNGDLEAFPRGEPYRDTTHPFTYDLDIFGKNSVFQLVNRCACISGEERVVNNLTTPATDPEKIRERQRAISELAPQVDFRQHFMATGQGVQENSGETRQLLDWITASKSGLNRPLIRFFSYLLPAVPVVLLILAFAGLQPHSRWFIAVLINLSFMGLFLPGINKIHNQVTRSHRLLEKYSRLLKLIHTQPFGEPALKSLSQSSRHASASIQNLAGLVSFFDQRLNFATAILLNGFFLSDLHCIAAMDRWRSRYKARMPGWLESIFRVDELNSFANFAYNHPDYCYPQFQERSFLSAAQLGHPLIKSHPCVPNDFTPAGGEKVIILTGANMSGKSTFLRSLGVNLVLAHAGAPVFAREFSCNPGTGIYSSMRVTDSLEEDTSYFYAELKRLASVMARLRDGQKLIILLDEILKGTNSADKHYGSAGLVKEFLGYDCLCLIATHDLELGKLEHKHPGQVSNYCFESQLAAHQLHFDYKIRRGIAQNKNATFLMRKSGLIK